MTCRRLARAAAAALAFTTAVPAVAQTPEEIEAEPLVKLRPGATPVDGQCLTEQELELIERLDALSRPTVGVEGAGGGDDAAPFDPHYFVGRWTFEGVLPESPLGASGDFTGTETIRHVDGCTYESVIEGALDDAPLSITSRMYYDRQSTYLVRVEDDSRGFDLLKMGRVGGDPGGFFSHHWQAPPVAHGGARVTLAGRTYVTSPFAFRIQMRIAVDGGPLMNYGTVWWDRVEP